LSDITATLSDKQRQAAKHSDNGDNGDKQYSGKATNNAYHGTGTMIVDGK